jgi:hypothetical protein
MKETAAIAAAIAAGVGIFAWLVPLPTIGLLWVLGWLP